MAQSIGKIGIIMPYIRDVLFSEFLQGVYEQAAKLGFDTLIFTCAADPLYVSVQSDYAAGENNIFTLPENAELDGILFAADRFSQEFDTQPIFDMLRKKNIPCLVTGEPHEGFACMSPPQAEAFERITNHMLQEHHVKSCYILTGTEDNVHAIERLRGFQRAVRAAGLPEDKTLVFYGNFWKSAGVKLGIQIAEGQVPMPEAVVCANDAMAVALCETLQERGISVPDQIRISGYDGVRNALDHYPMITTLSGMEGMFGQLAVNQLYERITGEKSPVEADDCLLLVGTSCGCTPDAQTQLERGKILKRNEAIGMSFHEHQVIADYYVRFSEAESMQELLESMHLMSHFVPTCKRIELCLCDDWKTSALTGNQLRESGYSGQIELVFCRGEGSGAHDVPITFAVSRLLPSLSEPHEPRLVFFTPLHCRRQVLGYCAATYESVNDFCSQHYDSSWCDAVAYGFHSLRNRLYTRQIEQQMLDYLQKDQMTGMLNRRGLLNQMPTFFEQNPEDAMLLLLYCREPADTGLDTESRWLHAITNAIQLSCGIGEIAARIHSEVFAFLLPHTSDMPPQEQTERWIMRFERSLETVQKREKMRFHSRILSDSIRIKPMDAETADALLTERMQILSRRIAEPVKKTSDYVEPMKRIRREIYLEPQLPWTVSGVASRLGISFSYLERIYLKQFGVNLKEDIISARLQKAKDLLKRSELHISEIAEQCGYSDVRSFIRAFKKLTGKSPTQYNHDADS